MTDTPGGRRLELARLRWKYETILALRLRPKSERAPVLELRALAAEFPGALRELDSLSVATVHDRIEAIVHAELDPRARAPWMLAELGFAEAMRGAKAAKAWLRGRRDVDDAVIDSFRREIEAAAHADDARAWADDLAALARPPSGRLVPLVVSRVARELGLSAEATTALLFRERVAPQDPDLEGVVEGAGAALAPPPEVPSDFLLELSPLDDEPPASEEVEDGVVAAPPDEPPLDEPGLEDE